MCTNQWGPPARSACLYRHTDIHLCGRRDGHPGRCQCRCGATTMVWWADAPEELPAVDPEIEPVMELRAHALAWIKEHS